MTTSTFKKQPLTYIYNPRRLKLFPIFFFIFFHSFSFFSLRLWRKLIYTLNSLGLLKRIVAAYIHHFMRQRVQRIKATARVGCSVRDSVQVR